MADNKVTNAKGAEQANPWPEPKFHFKVTFGDVGVIDFQEVSGLDTEYDMMESQTGTSQSSLTVEQSNLGKQSDVTLKKGMFKDDETLFKYFSAVTMNVIKRELVTIQLLDEAGAPLFTWELKNAWPMKVSSTDLNAQSREVAIEEITLAHEGLSMKIG